MKLDQESIDSLLPMIRLVVREEIKIYMLKNNIASSTNNPKANVDMNCVNNGLQVKKSKTKDGVKLDMSDGYGSGRIPRGWTELLAKKFNCGLSLVNTSIRNNNPSLNSIEIRNEYRKMLAEVKAGKL